jgi:UDP-2,3-diacylglucosamine pyrophosphatase LpxH
MDRVTIAVASDLHCALGSASGDSYLTAEMPLRPVSHHPVRSLLNLIREEDLRADVLAVPGDLAHQANSQGLRIAWRHARSIQKALRARRTIATLGNHDVCRGGNPLSLAQDAHDEFPVCGTTAKAQYWSAAFCIKRIAGAAFVVLNTVPLFDPCLAKTRGQVTDLCLDKMEEELAKLRGATFRVALCHHHPVAHDDVGQSPQDLMENADKLVQLLARHRFDLVLHGHKHYPRLRPAPTAEHRMLVLAAGSLSAVLGMRLATRTRNTFHIVRLQREFPGGTCRGIVTTWQWHLEKEWTPASRDSADLPHQSGFGSGTAPERLADEIASSLVDSGCWSEAWGNIVGSYPDVEYLDTSQWAIFERVLREKHGIEVDWPNPPVHPRKISRITSGGP